MILRVAPGDRREQRRWQRELQRQLDALPTYDGDDAPDGGPVTPVGRSLPRPARPSRRERRALLRAAAAQSSGSALGGRTPAVTTERRRTVLTVGITLAVILGVLFMSPLAEPLRATFGWNDRGEDSSYEFLQRDQFTGDPTTWRSCEPIRIEVNPDGAPDGWEDNLDQAIDEISEASGLEMTIVGTTDRRPDFEDRPAPFRDAPPVLVAWADPDEVPKLEGDTVGLAGPRTSGGFYVTGTVAFDSRQFGDIERNGADKLQRAIMMHELGHLIGLDHVQDELQLMYPTTTFQVGLGNGDREGLRILGEGGC